MMVDIRAAIQRLVRRGVARPPAGPGFASGGCARLPASHVDAAAALATRPAEQPRAYLTAKVKTAWTGSHPDIVRFYQAVLAEFEKRGMLMYAHEFLRDGKRQDALRAAGVSNAGAGQSPHNWGCAVDIVHFSRLWNLTRKEWDVIGAIGKEVARRKEIPIAWGGEFKSLYDPAHWEIAHWRDLRRLEMAAAELGGCPLPAGDNKFHELERRYLEERRRAKGRV